MRINTRRAFQYALVGIAASGATQLAAQESRLSPVEIGRIVDAVLGQLIPSSQLLSRVSVGQRGVFFDNERTLAAFGHDGAAIPLSDLGLRTVVAPGRRSLLSDCSGFLDKPCRQLGWGVYVWIEPLSVRTSEAVVRATVHWAERGGTAFAEGIAPTGPALLVGFSTEVQLARSADGTWTFVKRGPMYVGE